MRMLALMAGLALAIAAIVMIRPSEPKNQTVIHKGDMSELEACELRASQYAWLAQQLAAKLKEKSPQN